MPELDGERNALADGNELLFRQIHPSFMQNGSPTSQAFMPIPKDKGGMSVDRSSVYSASKSFHEYTVVNGFQSVAVFGLTVAEFAVEAIPCYSDPVPATNGFAANPAHCIADFSGLHGSAQKNVAKRLKIVAVARGQKHR